MKNTYMDARILLLFVRDVTNAMLKNLSLGEIGFQKKKPMKFLQNLF